MTDDRNKIDDARRADLAALEHALDVHGGDVSRWPMPERRRHAALIAADRDAQRLVKEARALDTLIATASQRDDVVARAIAQRAVAAVLKEQGASRGGSEHDEAPPARQAQPGNVVVLHRGSGRKRFEAWAAAAALVACLGLGIVLGQSGWIDPAIDVIAGLEDQASQTGGLFDDQAELFEEDVI